MDVLRFSRAGAIRRGPKACQFARRCRMRPFGPRHLLVTVCKFVVLVCCLCAACSLGAGVGGGFCHVRSIDEGRGAGGHGCQGVIVWSLEGVDRGRVVTVLFLVQQQCAYPDAHGDGHAGQGEWCPCVAQVSHVR